MTHEELKEKTLEWCNEKREEKGMEPLKELPKGEPHDGLSCPCGKATGLFVAATVWTDGHWLNRDQETKLFQGFPKYRLPEPVREFIEVFDNGGIPELMENPELWSFGDDR